MKEPIISVSGLRGIIGESLSPELAMRFAIAFAQGLRPGPLLITRDGRTTGPILADAVRSGLCAVGRAVIDAGVAATPTTGVLVRSLSASGGVQISASHNPPAYNGLKLFGPDGSVLTAAVGEEVLSRFRAGGQPPWAPHDQIGELLPCADPLGEHLRLVLETVDVDRIRRRRFTVLLDSNHGAGSLLGGRLLKELGCEVTILGGSPDGHFQHTAEPTAENLTSVAGQVQGCGAEIGFCQDPDADRLAVIDEHGQYLGEEYTLALCLDHVLRQKAGPVVTNCATSRMAEDLAASYGAEFHRSAVGEANVVEAMRKHDAVFGGEGNGGPIDPRVGFVRDSFVGMALILDAMAARQRPVSELAAELPVYAIHKTKIPLARDQVAAGLDALRQKFPGAQSSALDGLRLDWPGRWLLVRASNTEPIVRAIAEAPTASEAQSLCAQAEAALSAKREIPNPK